MAGSQAITLVAEKYLPEVVAGLERPLDYRDALVEPGQITVKTTEMDPALGGWLGYVFTVSKKGALRGPTAVVTAEPSISAFRDWAKGQSVAVLQRYLAGNGITATGNIVFMLAYRLTYLYEELYHKRHESWPLDPGRMEARLKKITIISKLINLKGVGTHPDEDAIAKLLLMQDGKIPWNLTHREESPVADEKRSDTLKRLRAQAHAEEVGAKENGKKGNAKDDATGAGTETAAVKAGKGKRTKSTAPAAPTPAAATHEETDVKKSAATKGKKATTKAKSTKVTAEKKAAPSANHFPLECKVKYIGTRVKHHVGKTGTVVAHLGGPTGDGLKIKWSDGLIATATTGACERVK